MRVRGKRFPLISRHSENDFTGAGQQADTPVS